MLKNHNRFNYSKIDYAFLNGQAENTVSSHGIAPLNIFRSVKVEVSTLDRETNLGASIGYGANTEIE